MKIRKIALFVALVAPMTMAAQTKKYDAWRAENGVTLPTWAIKTNLLADLTTSMNLALELRTGGKTSIDLMGQWNPFNFRGGLTEWRHWGVQPELRLWTKETFRGHFFGLHAHYAFYNVGGLWNGPFSDYMHNNRFQGDLYGAGVSWGHRWNFSRRWGLEVTAGVGWAHKDYERFDCVACGEKLGEKTKEYFGPTKLGVNLIFGGGEKTVAVAAPPVAPMAPAKAKYEPRFTPEYITPAVEATKTRAESGEAYLEFPVGNANVNPSFRNNAAELAKIEEMVNKVKNDPDATIKGITIVGNASPEGSFAGNMTLSQRRAESLKTLLRSKYDLQSSIIEARGAGEDWATLSRLVKESDIEGRGALLDVIDGAADYDARDRAMMAEGAEAYNTMKTEIYPRLRRTDYTLDYEVAPISVERGKEIMKTNPRNLSLNELFIIANTYAAGSEEFREVNEIAARTFPDSDVANNNAAAAALQRGDAAAAATWLAKVKNHDADWNNNMGILSYMRGNATQAADYFRAAGVKAAVNAAELSKYFDSVK